MGFFLIEYGRLYVGKSDCEYEQIIIYFCFIFPQAIWNFPLNAFIFLMELHFVHNYHIQVEQYRLFCSYLFDFVLFSALLSVLWKQENEEIDNIQKTCNLDEMYSGSSQLHVV